MAAEPKSPRPLPLGAIGANALGTVLLAAGIAGLVVPETAGMVPALADPTTAWSLVGVGLALEFWSLLALVNRLRER